jgi:hypothetical protein
MRLPVATADGGIMAGTDRLRLFLLPQGGDFS